MSWTGRTIPTATWDGRNVPGENCMDVIITGMWDDVQLWQDEKIWWDNGSSQYAWTIRIIPS